MQPILTREQMQAMDRLAIETVGVPSLVLMEVAGRAVADAAQDLARGLSPFGSPFSYDSAAVLCIAGTGNNGADAVVCARHLRERGQEVTVLVLGEKDRLTEEAQTQLRIANRLGVETIVLGGAEAADRVADALPAHGVIVDGLFGLGLARPIEGWRRQVVEVLEAAPHAVVAVDIPSGIDANTGQVLGEAITADITVTFQFRKVGQLLHPGRTRCGELRVVDIGIPPSRLFEVAPVVGLLETDTLEAALPPRALDAHKGTFGHLLVAAGAPDRPGSALLAARAALRTGAGLVTIGSDEETISRLAPALVEVMGLSLGRPRMEAERLVEAIESRSALAIGPSLDPDDATKGLLQSVLQATDVPAVVDAGALSALGADIEWLRERSGPTIITPHPGEAARLLAVETASIQRDRLGAARRLSERTATITVLKGATTVIAEPEGDTTLSTAGNPGLATGGSGDVLLGVIGGLLAQGVEPALAARAGVELHGLAADRARDHIGERAMLASDVVRFLAGPIDGVDGVVVGE